MNSKQRGDDLPRSVAQKLRAIRRRAITLTLLEGLILTLAVLVGAMLLAMLVDWMIGWFDPRARYTFTILALAVAAVAFAFWCIRPLARRRTIISTAREVDATVPQLEERWSTVTELSQSQDAPEVRGSEAMIHKVASEAELANARITPKTVVSAQPMFRAGRWLIGAAAALVLVFAINFTAATRLLQRFWMPGEEISLTQVTASPADVWVARGEALTVNATVKGRVPKQPALLFLRAEHSGTRSLAMTAKTGSTGAFQHAIEDVSDSFQYRVRSGDGQTPWHRITAVDRPKISEVSLKVTPPPYSKLPKEEKTSLPGAVRVLEGSEVDVSFRADQPVERMLVDFGNGQSAQLVAGSDNWYHFRSRPTNSFTFAAAAINKFKLENKNKPSCRISVYEDLPPSVKILDPSDDIAVLPGEKVNVTFEASDDFGVARAELIVSATRADGETNSVTIPVELESDAGRKQLKKTVELDPKALGLKHGDQLSYVVQVTDTKQTPASASLAEARAQAQPQQSPPQLADASDAKAKEQENQTDAKANDKEQPPLAEASKNEENASKPSESNSKNAPQGSSKSSSLTAKASNQSEQKQSKGDRPPPNEMEMRMLDAGQSSACKPRNISVDEWAGTFEGEKRKKLEIAIDPILERLKELLAKAQQKTESLKEPAASAEGLQQSHAAPIKEAKGNLGESQQAIGDLKARTSGTPYAFIGLQLHNINEAHIVPADKSLAAVAIPAVGASNNVAQIDKASFHISRAREMLADLTRTYDTVKRDQQIADAMQKLNKMYQIFLEDTQALLGSSKGPINSYDRKIAEVDEEFAKKLQELLEEKKKIMAELARVLAEDPRMLRRYMAMLELQGTSYRDQMTLLAERQKQLKEQVAKWNATPEADRAALLPQFRESYSEQQKQVALDATKFRENLETWLPLDVKADAPEVQPVLTRAEKIVQLTAESTKPENTEAAQQALTELRALRESLPQLNEINSTNKSKMTAHVANRLADVESLITAQSGQMKIAESFNKEDFPKVAEILQSRITQDTVTLGDKLEATETQAAQMSDEIAKKAAQLNKITQTDIIPPQGTSVSQLSVRDVKAAEEILNGVVPAFASAENTFDELMRLMIAKLDEAPPPSAVGSAPGLEDIMALLEDEKKAAEGLGIPCRPINVSIMKDWMRPSSNPGQGMGRAQAQAAQAQAQDAKSKARQLEKQARESAQKALTEARQNGTAENADAKARSEAWNKLVSKLQKDLLQGRDNTPPEQYRQAIENYFRVISESPSEGQK
jgi:hypothetical protein